MAETRLLIDEKKLTYAGLIPVQGLYKCVKTFLAENDFSPFDSRNEEQVYEDGKQIILELTGEKKLSEFARIYWQTKFYFTNLKEMFVEKEGKKLRLHQGKVMLQTDVYLKTDYEKTFEQNAFQYFLRVLIDTYVFKSYMNRNIALVMKNYGRFEETVKRFLNMEAFK